MIDKMNETVKTDRTPDNDGAAARHQRDRSKRPRRCAAEDTKRHAELIRLTNLKIE
jgi:hypothetical protein